MAAAVSGLGAWRGGGFLAVAVRRALAVAVFCMGAGVFDRLWSGVAGMVSGFCISAGILAGVIDRTDAVKGAGRGVWPWFRGDAEATGRRGCALERGFKMGFFSFAHRFGKADGGFSENRIPGIAARGRGMAVSRLGGTFG